MRARLFKHPLPLLAVAVVLAGLLAGYWAYGQERDQLLAGLVREAERAVALMDETEVAQLTATAADVPSPVYAAIKARLRRYRTAHAHLRGLRLFRVMPDSHQVVWLADAEPLGASGMARPGDHYTAAAGSPSLQAVIAQDRFATEGPGREGADAWMTVYTALSRDAAGVARDIFGVDLAVSDWRWRLWTAGSRAAVYVWLLGGLPLVGYYGRRRQREQNEVIRNLSEALEQSQTAVMIIDRGGRIEHVNHDFCVQAGQGRREMIGRLWREFLRDTVPQETATELTAVFYGRTNWRGEWMNRRPDGAEYPVRGRLTAVHNRHGRVTCFVAVYEDMTEIRHHEAVLHDAKAKAEAGDRAKSNFLVTMSHEVRTPLNGIVGFTNLLLETSLDAEQEEYMRAIRTSGEALIQLANDILDSSRIESGKLQLELHRCNPVDCIEDAFDMVATRASAKPIELVYTVDANVPESVLTDAGRLRQVLLNLIGNAVKFTEQGEVVVTLSARQADRAAAAAPGYWDLEFVVTDTGIGIDEADLPKLLEPFGQLEETIARRYGGAGLGLAISRSLVELMGGDIKLTSTVGVGSSFTFTIRAEEAPADESRVHLPHNIAGLRVAVAAQPGILRNELCRLLGRWGALATPCLPEELATISWDTALVDLTEALVRDIVQEAGALADLPRDKMIALVPLRVPPTDRTGLRPRFRLLVNKPAHHQALLAALASPVGRSALPLSFATRSTFDLRVLVVEDNPVNQLFMQKVMGHLGCQWAVAENGAIALEELRRTDFHLVLMDLHMPVMDGHTAITKIRQGEAGEAMRSVWITAVTADTRQEQKERILHAGANDYLLKPVRLKDMDAMLRRFMARPTGASAS